jgi:hypothetical protein
MILLGHERQCFSRTNKRSARRRPPASLRRTVSDRDLAYLIRTLLRFSMQQERGLSSPTAQFARILPAAGCHRRIGCTPCREGSGRPPSDVPRQRQSWQGPPAGRAGPPAGRAGSRIQGAMPAAAATGRKVLRIRSMMQACTVVSTHTSSTTTHFTSGTPSGEI